MFTHFRNIDTAFQHIKRFSLALIVAGTACCCFTIYVSYKMVRDTQQKIYVLANGKAIEAFSAERKDNLQVELRDHIKTFHHWFFTLDPDEKVIQGNISKALYLADESAKRAYDNLREKGFYNNLIAANISQEVSLDSLILDTGQYPYAFRSFATQRLVRSSTSTTRKLVTQGKVRNVSRSDNNPHGFLILEWETLSNTEQVVP